MKIKLPNPDDYDGDVMMFLEQLELSVHHAKKTWEKLTKNMSVEELSDENTRPYVTYRIDVLQEDYNKYAPILDGRAEQDIDIEINTP